MNLSVFMIYLTIICTTLGVVYNSVGEKAVFLLVVLTSIFTSRFHLNLKLLFSIIVFLGYVGVKSILGGSVTPSSDYHSLWTQQVKIIEVAFTFIAIHALMCSEQIKDKRIIKHCIKISLSCYIFTIIFTIIFLIKNDRLVYRNNPESIGLFCAPQSFLTFAIVISSVLLEKLRNRDLKQKWISILIISINTIYVLLMSYTTQIAFYFLALALVILFGMIRRRNFIAIICVFLIVNPFVIQFMAPPLLQSLSNSLFKDVPDVQMRLNEVIQMLSGADEIGRATNLRIDVMLTSLTTFLNYPIFGVPFSQYNSGELLVIGGHQEWIDDLARYGLVGFTAFFYFIYTGLSNGICFIRKKNSHKTLVIVFLLYGFLNPFINFTFVIACTFGILIEKYIELENNMVF